MNGLIWIVLATLAGGPVDVTTLDGKRQPSELVALTEDEATILVDGASQAIELRELQAMDFAADDSAVSVGDGAVEVRLVDGTLLIPTAVKVEQGKLRLTSATLGELECEATQLRTLRFAIANDTIMQAWTAISERAAKTDLVIVQKGENLDYIAAVIGAVTETEVSFSVKDRPPATVPLSRVFGLVYATRETTSKPPVCQMVLRSREEIPARKITIAAGQATVETVAGLKFSLPIDGLSRLDFSQGKVKSLVEVLDLSRAKFESQWPVSFVQPEFSLRGDGKNRSGDPLLLGGKSYSQGLYVHSGFVVRGTLNKQYRRLQGQFGLDENGEEYRRNIRPAVKVTITGDGRPLLEQSVNWENSPGTPVALDLDVSDVKVLEIRIDSATTPSRFGSCEVVDFVDARLLK